MNRTLEITIDHKTWPTNGAPGFPPTFIAGNSSHDVPVLPTLLLIGQLTTPPVARGVSLSEFWAWVRYLYAVSGDADLRISRDFASLDSHQKTILSDDFGMGVPIGYLIGKLGLTAWSDGRYFMDRMSALVAGPLPIPHKRGPKKAPDFVLVDTRGLFHIVECKGGQSGHKARDRQISHVTADGVQTGGVVQKQMVKLPAHLQGQRLVCGLSLGKAGQARPSGVSNLKIVDPDFEIEYDISEMDDLSIGDPIARAVLAKSLRSGGFGLAAAAVAAPSGTSARSLSTERLKLVSRISRRRGIEQRNAAARAELSSPAVPTFTIGDRKLAGREVSMVLPLPLMIDGRIYRRVIIRQGVTLDLIAEIQERGLTENPLPFFDTNRKDLGRTALRQDGPRGELWLNGSFASEIILEQSEEVRTVVSPPLV